MPAFEPLTPAYANSRNLQRLLLIRIIALAAQAAAVAAASLGFHLTLPLQPIITILLGMVLWTGISAWRLRRRGDITQGEFFAQLLVDVLALTGFLYFTGGATNPLVLLFLLPLTISVTLLPGRYTWPLAAITAVCYSLLMWQHIPLPHVHTSGGIFTLHVTGMWLAFVLLAALLAYFVAGMGRALHQQQQALAAARETQLRDERLLAVGTLAASTAHELGTPLGTMALLAEDMEQECAAGTNTMQSKIAALRQQIDRCKQALSTLSASAGEAPLTDGRAIAIDRYLEELLRDWRQTRPNINIDTQWQGSEPAPRILADRSLTQALTNILDNAADASPEAVQWHAAWDNEKLHMEIRDRGTGFSDEAAQRVGKQPYSNKQDGLGLGLFLAHAIIGRFGGHISLHSQDKGGVCTHITMPFSPFAGTVRQ